MIVLDASVVAALLLGALPQVEERLRDEHLTAPTLLDYEVLSALRGLALGGRISIARAGHAVIDLRDLPLRRRAIVDPLQRRVLDLRHNVTAYDAAYVVLAEALEVPLLTRDARLARSTGHDARIELV